MIYQILIGILFFALAMKWLLHTIQRVREKAARETLGLGLLRDRAGMRRQKHWYRR